MGRMLEFHWMRASNRAYNNTPLTINKPYRTSVVRVVRRKKFAGTKGRTAKRPRASNSAAHGASSTVYVGSLDASAENAINPITVMIPSQPSAPSNRFNDGRATAFPARHQHRTSKGHHGSQA